jgi:hypothetical protein
VPGSFDVVSADRGPTQRFHLLPWRPSFGHPQPKISSGESTVVFSPSPHWSGIALLVIRFDPGWAFDPRRGFRLSFICA